MNEQWNRLTRAVGNVFLPIVKQLLPYLNAILMVFTEIINSIAILVGYNEEDFDYFKGATEDVTDLELGLEGANASAKKLNNSLRSFDRLNNITTGNASASALGVGSGISPEIMKLFNKEVDKYNSTLENVQMKATKIRDSIMDWLGFTKQIDPLTGKISFKFDHITGGTVLGALAIGGSIFKGIKTIVGILGRFNIGKTTGDTATAFTKLKSSLTGLLIGGTSLYAFDKIMKDINKDGTNTAKTLGLVATGLGTIGGLAYAGFKATGSGWGAVIGGISGALLVLHDVLTQLPTEYSKAAGEIEKNLEKIDAYNDSLKEKYENIQQNLILGLTEQGVYEELIKELDTLVEKNGKIKLGYEDRVDFIANQLKNAYGIELEIVNGTIKNYDNQIKKIKELMIEKKKQITLESLESGYKVAITEKANSYYAIKQATKEAEKAQILYNEALAKYQEKTKKYNPDNPWSRSIVKAKDDLDAASEALTKANQVVDDAKNNYASNVRAIAQYEKLYSMDVKTNTENVEQYLNQLENTYTKNGKNIQLSYEEQIDDALMFYSTILNITKENNGEINEELFATAEQRLSTLKTNLSDMTNAIEGQLGNNVVDAWGTLASTSESKFLEEFAKLKDDVQKEVVNQMYKKGYDISKELQKGIDAINPKIKINIDIDKAVNLLNSFNSSLANSFGIKLPTLNAKAIKKIAGYAGGGLPSVGQLMYVNEKGPELVSQIGGQSFVANQNQVVDFMERELGDAKSNNPTTMNFYLDANHKLGTYTLEQLQSMAKTNGQPIRIGG